MSDISQKLNNFINSGNESESQEYCDPKTGKCFIKTKDGLIERTIIEKKLVVEDGRELLREETPISNSNRTFLR